VVAQYHDRLEAADAVGTVERFDPKGSVREPTGEHDTHSGTTELLRFFGRLLATGGISVERCSLTDDGTSCALEYNLTAWGAFFSPNRRASRSTT
jgi:hypothetical protein